MKYNALLTRHKNRCPVNAILELEIPDHLSDEGKLIFAAEKLLKEFRVEIDPILPEKRHKLEKTEANA